MRHVMAMTLFSLAALTLGTEEARSQLTDQRALPFAPRASVSTEEQEWILHVRQQEKLARDVYLTLDAVWEGRTELFGVTANAEARHMNAVGQLIALYRLPDPVGYEQVVGEFSDPSFRSRYLAFVEFGASGIAEAFEVGAIVETRNLLVLEAGLEVVVAPHAREVFYQLAHESQDHLDAFLEAHPAFQGDGRMSSSTSELWASPGDLGTARPAPKGLEEQSPVSVRPRKRSRRAIP